MCRKSLPAIPFIMVGLFLLIGVVFTLPSCQRSSPASAPSPTVVGSGRNCLPTTVTDANGRFLFAPVSPATHQLYLIESALPRRWQSGSDSTPVKLTLNPGMTVSRQVLPSVVLEAWYQDDVISGIVFADLDRDGQMGARDLALAGVTVVDPNLHHYFVPFYDRDLWQLLSGVNRCQRAGYGDVSDTLESTIALTGWVDGTQWLYDHWEDGYLCQRLADKTHPSAWAQGWQQLVWCWSWLAHSFFSVLPEFNYVNQEVHNVGFLSQ